MITNIYVVCLIYYFNVEYKQIIHKSIHEIVIVLKCRFNEIFHAHCQSFMNIYTNQIFEISSIILYTDYEYQYFQWYHKFFKPRTSFILQH